MKTILAMLTACIMLLAAPGCSAADMAASEQAEATGYASYDMIQVAVEQVLDEYNSARRSAPSAEESPEDTEYDDGSAQAKNEEAADVETPAEEPPQGVLAVTRCACQIGSSYIVYPRAEGETGKLINDAICSAVSSRAEELGIAVFADYRVEYNRNGIFSLRMFLYDMYGDADTSIDCVPLTFNSENGQLYRISDFFDSDSDLWRGRIPDIIAAQAEEYQMVLLGDVMPISDDRSFYITDEAVVIMYDLYEITTYSAGEPEFEIAVDDIAECIDDTSALNAMLPPELPAEGAEEPAQEEPVEVLQVLDPETAPEGEEAAAREEIQ